MSLELSPKNRTILTKPNSTKPNCRKFHIETKWRNCQKLSRVQLKSSGNFLKTLCVNLLFQKEELLRLTLPCSGIFSKRMNPKLLGSGKNFHACSRKNQEVISNSKWNFHSLTFCLSPSRERCRYNLAQHKLFNPKQIIANVCKIFCLFKWTEVETC